MPDKQSFDIFDHYSVQKILARTEISSTYLASAREQAESSIIIKIINRDYLGAALNDAELSTYIKTLLSLRHRSIVPLFDVIFNKTQLYTIRAYLAHDSLNQRMQTSPDHRLAWKETLDIILSVGQALTYAHKQMVTHGSVKPENILFNKQNEATLADFSLAPAIHLSTFASPANLHTAHYMAPEQFMGQMSSLSDQYALACLAYTLTTGHPPFEARNFTSLWNKHANEHPTPISTLLPQLPRPFSHAIMTALAKDPHQRYPDMAAFLFALTSSSDMLSAQTEISQNLEHSPYGVAISTSLLHEPTTHTNTPLAGAASFPSNALPEEPDISRFNAPLIDPYNETMTMFTAGDVVPADKPSNLPPTLQSTNTGPGNAGLQSTLAASQYPSINAFLHTHTSQNHTSRFLFWAALLLLLVLFTSSCLALFFNQPASGQSAHIVLHIQSIPTQPASTSPQPRTTPSPRILQTPQSSKKSAPHASPPATVLTPAPIAVPSPQSTSPVTQPAQPISPSSIPEGPWWNSGRYGSWPHRPPAFFPFPR